MPKLWIWVVQRRGILSVESKCKILSFLFLNWKYRPQALQLLFDFPKGKWPLFPKFWISHLRLGSSWCFYCPRSYPVQQCKRLYKFPSFWCWFRLIYVGSSRCLYLFEKRYASTNKIKQNNKTTKQQNNKTTKQQNNKTTKQQNNKPNKPKKPKKPKKTKKNQKKNQKNQKNQNQNTKNQKNKRILRSHWWSFCLGNTSWHTRQRPKRYYCCECNYWFSFHVPRLNRRKQCRYFFCCCCTYDCTSTFKSSLPFEIEKQNKTKQNKTK